MTNTSDPATATAKEHTTATSLRLEGLCRRIGGRPILDGITLEVAAGECLALLGPSGCGKSTVLRVIAGLDPCDGGRIVLDGRDITEQKPARRRVAMVFQSYALYPHLSVERNLSLGMELRGVAPEQRERELAAVLELLQLSALRRRRPAELSGGQRQRVALARALLRKPQLMLLDEPMSNLDAQLREELRPQLRAILCGGRAPAIYVTHDQQEAMGIADRIAVLEDGRLQQCGTPQELYHHPANLFVAGFIGRPQINLLPRADGTVVGIRPEHLKAVSSGGLPVRVLNREWHGASQLLLLESEQGPLRWTCDGNQALGDGLRLDWERRHEHRFQQASGERC
ncbi:ABC transporter ATP-binding protein [Cyanobium sp. ATX 6A2]|uniref:ABC transporter ATP-binding protein n=1 Tax=Cyanobium sp. ATX 6A2 TaxID=2823700 RepID=UPI0020CBB883|nr:ABC transporter ATP-binding protein [Cyanobium sp. ATX 6A2]MCP9888065.1 ABC transporter ATP-binding protein [Cyanobium sp. ATX 6A2]